MISSRPRPSQGTPVTESRRHLHSFLLNHTTERSQMLKIQAGTFCQAQVKSRDQKHAHTEWQRWKKKASEEARESHQSWLYWEAGRATGQPQPEPLKRPRTGRGGGGCGSSAAYHKAVTSHIHTRAGFVMTLLRRSCLYSRSHGVSPPSSKGHSADFTHQSVFTCLGQQRAKSD